VLFSSLITHVVVHNRLSYELQQPKPASYPADVSLISRCCFYTLLAYLRSLQDICPATIIRAHRHEIADKDQLEHRAAMHRQRTDDTYSLRPATTLNIKQRQLKT
jgi:hypothetical protein